MAQQSHFWFLLLICLLIATFTVINAQPFTLFGNFPLKDKPFIYQNIHSIKRGGDFCGCNMGCFYRSAGQCASCCSLGL
uniref:Transmembrane protein n=1 Tax=Panagrolaimus sp. JU765 TaxID=591449 RepID=A0AC34REP8_9BILA